MTAQPPTTSDHFTLAHGGTLAVTAEQAQVGVGIGDGGAQRRIVLRLASMGHLAQHLADAMAGPARVPEPATGMVLSGEDLVTACALRLSGTRAHGLTIAITDAEGVESEAALSDAEAQWLAARSMILTLEAKWEWSSGRL